MARNPGSPPARRTRRARHGLSGMVALAASVNLGLARLANAEPVALTFDDVPALALSEQPAYARVITKRLVSGLRRNGIPTTAFVVGSKLEAHPVARDAMLRQWRRAGFELANHTYSHESLSHMPAEAFIADTARNDALLRRLQHSSPHWFRHPYLEMGASLADKAAVDTWLAANGYRVAPVTLENADDIFAYPYDRAVLAHDRKAAAQVRAAYLAFTARSIDWYRAAALQLFGRRPALVFLLHASRLNADCVDDLAVLLRKADLRPVSLTQAMRDPVYGLADGPLERDSFRRNRIRRWRSSWRTPVG